ncbi:winged helix-turn-helix transcriptional regulator [Clostridium botulinum]|uniref:MarR family winged helix-turn-helix transcriptional regulator n=1 Tax=Clostridium TaxID=1485 RepID=UPI0002DA2810|nr:MULTISPECIES: MarR family winged helix-turn-helix transcriptional regulator [Clostridium]NFG40425.1 winged helix-turn-helix transcriptional regulator [Clostridium botulinum]NFI04303.1 winged helix-turn-helix transcriptional regulator [Clostridium botulinum]NFI94436.1 winged helix-turn-helix transcriptional regulator [Clostridium botulinum]NFO91624.1 winged helix-turn-helix transcriptional regulator [Clostridium botulinum]NFT07211.1 winged helix-turn-helix transcriptional regulator [Clostrid
MNTQSNIDIKKFVETFENLTRLQKHNQNLMGIKKSEARVLLCIEHLSQEKDCNISVSSISKNLSIASPTATELIKNLTDKGYIERHINKNDKRFVEITLTNSGKKIVHKITEYYDTLFSGLVEKLGKQQSELLIELLSKVNIYFNEWYSNMN